MKSFYFIIVVAFLSMNVVFAQRAATHTITNFNVNTSTNKFSFDIYSQSTGASAINVGITNYLIIFNNSALSSPVISNVNSKYTTGSSTGDYDAMTVETSFGNEVNVTIRFTGAVSGVGDILSTTGPTGERICTVTLNITNQSATAMVSWDETNSAMLAANPLLSITNSYVGTFDNPLPVELSSFTASSNQSAVNLKWQTATEVNNYGFEIERASSSTMPLQVWEKVGFVNGNGNSNSPKTYSFSDNNPSGGSKFLYRLKQIDNDGQFEYSDAIEVEIVPKEFVLYQNYPNPFNPVTTIRYQLPKESKVVIKIYNILGAEVMELINEQKEPGIYEADFNAASLSSGTYIYKISADNFVQTKKMILLK